MKSDLEIYEHANLIISAISKEISQKYQELNGGDLKVSWHESIAFNAYAHIKNEKNQTPDHAVGLHYELARKLYHDCVEFYEFINIDSVANNLQNLPEFILHFPTGIDKDAAIDYMFVASFSWVFFHECGHLSQGHKFVRSEYLNNEKYTHDQIHESTSSESRKLSEEESLISHVTEFAADYHATLMGISGLIHNCLHSDIQISHTDKVDLVLKINTLYLLGINLVFYNFHEKFFTECNFEFTTSHPHPLLRVGRLITLNIEYFDLINNSNFFNHKFDKLHLTTVGADCSILAYNYWCWSRNLILDIDNSHLGINDYSNPNLLQYYNRIITAWDKVLPTIDLLFDHEEVYLMVFSKQFRTLTRNDQITNNPRE